MGTYDAEVVPPPPMEPGDLPSDPARWPSVLGWFSIVLGGLGILKNLCGAISNLALGGMMFGGFGQTPEQKAAMDKAISGLGGVLTGLGVLAIISLFVSVLLLVAGIQLVQRRPASIKLHWLWIGIRVVIGLAECGLAVMQQSAMMKAAIESMPQRQGGPSPASMAPFMSAAMGCGVCFGVVLVIAYPVAVSIVLTRPWARADAARWRATSPGTFA